MPDTVPAALRSLARMTSVLVIDRDAETQLAACRVLSARRSSPPVGRSQKKMPPDISISSSPISRRSAWQTCFAAAPEARVLTLASEGRARLVEPFTPSQT